MSSFISISVLLILMLIKYQMQAGTYTEFVAVFANVFLGMQLALSSYLQVCFSITNDVVMSISLMYEKPESGASWSIPPIPQFKANITTTSSKI